MGALGDGDAHEQDPYVLCDQLSYWVVAQGVSSVTWAQRVAKWFSVSDVMGLSLTSVAFSFIFFCGAGDQM